MNKMAWSFGVVGCVMVMGLVTATLRGEEEEHRRGSETQPSKQVSVGHEMEGMGRAYKSIKSTIKDPEKSAQTLAAIADLEQHTLAAKSGVPKSATTMPTAEENKQKEEDFQAMMVTLLRAELDLEEHVRAGRTDKAVEAFKQLQSLEEEGHGDFRMKERKG